MGISIKEAAAVTGIPVDTLRYYEKEGFILPKRHENGYRQYSESDIAMLKNIVVMKYAHFTLAEIKSMEELYTRAPSEQCNAIARRILVAKIAELRQAVQNYQKIIALMEHLLSMVDSLEAFHSNEEEIDRFIHQIFEDIQKA
jgi:DNA-binding transcriptional MerR regulator